nr:alpha/beta hydrolase [Bifidobacterium indicum]
MTMTITNTVYREGEGLPVILCHAFPVDHRMWGVCADSLINQADRRGLIPFPIYAPDMPGAGDGPLPLEEQNGGMAPDGSYPHALDQMAEAYVDLVTGLGHAKAIWVGLSMGGYLVEAVWRLHPEVVAGMALCDTTTKDDAPQSRANRLTIARRCLDTGGVDGVMHFARPQEGDSRFKTSPEFIDTMTGWIESQSPQGIAWRERMAAGRPDQTGILPGIEVPLTMVSGELDPSSPPRVMRPLADAATSVPGGVRFVSVPECGHFSAVERPDTVASALVDLVADVQGSGRGEDPEEC